MNALPKFLMLIFITILVVISTHANAGSVYLAGDTLYVRGILDPIDVEKFIDNRNYNFAKVDVSSPGGHAASIIKLARVIKKSAVPIYIHDVCASACFYILSIDKNVSVSSNTIVSIHHFSASMASMLKYTQPKASAIFESDAHMDRQWLRENGVDERILLISQLKIETICSRLGNEKIVRGIEASEYASKFNGWLLTPVEAKAYGVKASGEWISNKNDLIEALYIQGVKSFKINMADSHEFKNMNYGFLSKILEKTPKCN